MIDNSVSKTNYSFVELFCGGGGFGRGFHQSGFLSKVAVDLNPDCVKTYKLNFPESIVLEEDVSQLRSEIISELLQEVGSDLPLLIASPPCEPYTPANQNRLKDPLERLYSDPIGQLMLHAIRLIGDLRPRFFVIENVISVIEGELRDELEFELNEVGYGEVYFNIIEAEKNGVPSVRPRLFISNVSFSDFEKQERVTVRQVCEELPDPRIPHGDDLHELRQLNEDKTAKLATLRPGQALITFRGAGREMRNYIRLDWDETASTVMGKSRFIHPEDDRMLTPRENARLMTFPDEHLFTGTSESIYDQIGEAVPPLIAKLIGDKIRKLLRTID
ncbi:MAG: DNA cytosine methyltransferase [Candidatus Heimdallarchaeota archaeon]|nr:DNA cytosine methyltransferase [Candidatus Heimdallarchaeota archaeon]MCK5048727.1 DNA cytosine methyltransferase [Candidatus Heimdallarchaeota archaeon]